MTKFQEQRENDQELIDELKGLSEEDRELVLALALDAYNSKVDKDGKEEEGQKQETENL